MPDTTLLPTQFKIPLLMGILNVTDNSFSDGGSFLDPDKAFAQAQRLIHEGADIIDVGGESTRPGSTRVLVETELARVIPIVKRIRTSYPDTMISVDTRKSKVAKEVVALGVQIINDISALRFDPAMAEFLASKPDVKVILMHLQGEPENMQNEPVYGDVVAEIDAFFSERIAYAVANGIHKTRLLLDPGIGFGKNLQHNLSLLRYLDQFKHFGLSLVVGASRKRFINEINPSHTDERLGGSIASALIAAYQGVDILRVHDVKAHKQFFAVLKAIVGEQE